jgi:hypothetical protein
MSVDFYVCDNPACGETFPDCGPYFSCGDCGSRLCKDCKSEFNAKYTDGYLEDENGNEIDYGDYCPFCTLELVDNSILMDFALNKLGVSKEELTEQYKQEKSKQGK